MAIDLPPGISPALASTEEIRTYQRSTEGSSHTAIQSELAGYKVTVLGNTQLSSDEVKTALQMGDSLSDGVWHLHFAYMRAGYRLIRLRYVLDADHLYIRVLDGHISEIEGPVPLTRYFWEVEGREFYLPKLEARRTLANIQAKRLGLKTQSIYTPVREDGEEIRLILDTEPDEQHKSLNFSLETGNPGNRFVGRYFAFGKAVLNTESTEWKLNINHSLSGLDDDDISNGELNGYQISSSSILPVGLFGAAVSQTDYRFSGRNSNNDFRGEITQAQFLFQQIAYADPDQRNLVSQRLIFVDSGIEEQQLGQQVLDERYFAAEAGIEHSSKMHLGKIPANLKLAANLRKGLSDNTGTLGRQASGLDRDARFLSFMPGVDLRLKLAETLQVRLQALSQYSDGQVPEQQQWLLGGTKRMRAWLPGTLLGDTGHYLNLEVQTREYRWASATIQPTLFLEGGTSRFKTKVQSLSGRQRAYDAGIGVEIQQEPHWKISLTAAEPVSDPELNDFLTEGKEANLFVSLQFNW